MADTAHNYKMWLDFWKDIGREYLKFTPSTGVLQYARVNRASYQLNMRLDPMDFRYLIHLHASGSDGTAYRRVTTRWRGGCSRCKGQRRQWRGSTCVCRHCDDDVEDCDDDRLYGIWQLGATNLQRELNAVIKGEAESAPAETYVLYLLPRSAAGQRAADDRPPTPYFEVVRSGQIRDVLLQTPPMPPTDKPYLTKIHTHIGSIRSLVPDLQDLISSSYYWGKIDKSEAEQRLANKPDGTFLLRDSPQDGNVFAVSYRKFQHTLHAQIEQSQHQFTFNPREYALPTVAGLIERFKVEETVKFFEPLLSKPLPRPAPVSLQELARAAIVSTITYDDVDKLPLPPSAHAYLREYHYVQPVRVRSLEPDLFAYMREDEELLFQAGDE